MSFQLDKKQRVKEILKCGKDPSYFLNTYARISHPMHGLILFDTYDFQDELLKDFNDYRFNVILKARQLGISTVTAGYIVWMMLFHRDKAILVMATKFATAGNLVKKVKSVMRNLPDWLKISTIDVDNRTSFELSNGSSIKAASTSGDAGRSEALSLLVLDEAAHIENLEELWTGLYPTLSTGGRCIALSTPNGVGNWFHKTCVDAEAAANNFHLTTLQWDVHPDRDEDWYKKETKNMSKRQIAQELKCNFNTSGETVIDPECMEWLLTTVKEPKYRTGFDRNFWIWEEYDPTCNYLLVVDVARGDAADYSAFHIIKLETLECIGEYQGKATPDMYANMLNQVGREFGNCMLVVENNNIGYTVLDKLIEYEYPNLYYSIKSTHEYIEQFEGEYRHNAIPGFSTTSKTRPLIVAKLEEFIRNKLIKIYSSRTVNEMKTFIWRNGKPQAMKGYHDDLIMALAIACWVRDTALQSNTRELNYKKAFVDAILTSRTIMNTQIKGQQGYKKDDLFDKMSEAEKLYSQYKWIIK
ncbi:hypothetical protein CMI37_13990 [Candidatus Pacearchaeota archaeon]|nr:hypothetical protein [Candidatus Pacearchaeota archaeon]|tara:strand:- start:5526 stop:7109 length:1584 start_codon:yes stop_codon:yes gene_type:complete